jgi:hypothetical protein
MKNKARKIKRYPATGFMALPPTLEIVKVTVEPPSSEFPNFFSVTILDRQTDSTFFVSAAKLHTLNIYGGPKAAYQGELENLHNNYVEAKKVLAEAQNAAKLANRHVFEYKMFEKIQSIPIKGTKKKKT